MMARVWMRVMGQDHFEQLVKGQTLLVTQFQQFGSREARVFGMKR